MRSSAKTLLLMLGLAVLPACGEPVEDSEPVIAQAKIEQIAHNAQYVDTSARSCAWECQPCALEEGCQQSCTEVGDCGSTCSVVSKCVSGFQWDDDSCSCQPE